MITLVWSTQTTQRDPEGGDSARMVISELLIDGTIGEVYNFPSVATMNSIERGASSTDHIKKELQTIELTCRVSNDPYEADLQEEEHVDSVLESVRALRDNGQVIDVETTRGTFENYAILNISDTRDENTGDGALFTISLQEVVYVDVNEVDAPSPRVERGRRRADRGTQRTQDTESTETVSRAPENRSATVGTFGDAAASLGAGIGGLLR